MDKQILEVVTHAENALAYSNQALAVLDMWMDSLGRGDEYESNRVAAIHTLVHEVMTHLNKATEVQSAK